MSFGCLEYSPLCHFRWLIRLLLLLHIIMFGKREHRRHRRQMQGRVKENYKNGQIVNIVIQMRNIYLGNEIATENAAIWWMLCLCFVWCNGTLWSSNSDKEATEWNGGRDRSGDRIEGKLYNANKHANTTQLNESYTHTYKHDNCHFCIHFFSLSSSPKTFHLCVDIVANEE